MKSFQLFLLQSRRNGASFRYLCTGYECSFGRTFHVLKTKISHFLKSYVGRASFLQQQICGFVYALTMQTFSYLKLARILPD